MKSLKFCFAALIVLAMCTLSVLAQSTTTGAIGGTVANEKKEVVAGATVSVKNTATNKEDTGATDGEGRFKISNLQPGEYTVTINSTGFAPFTQNRVIVEVGRETSLDVGMTIGPIQPNTVEITAEAPVINTTQQDFSTNMNQTSINELPVNGQRWSNFALLTPGTVPDGNFGLISFRGISGLLNNNTVDGGDNNQAFFAEERGRTRINYVVSQNAIREFQVNTSNYSAEYGRAAGGVTNAVTKSGTNQFHGDAFFYDRDNRWGARNPLATRTTFDPTTGLRTVTGIKPTDKRYRFGGDIGGPIKKDKAFFFFNYDELRRNFPGLAIFSNPSYTVPLNQGGTLNNCTAASLPACTAAQNTASLKATATRNLTDAQINSVLSFLNTETGPNVRNGNQRIFMPKVDWNINSKNTFTATYNRLRWASISGIQTQPTNNFGVTSFGDDFVNDDSINLRMSSNLSSNLINEARYQWSRDFEFEFSKTPLAGEPLTSPAYPGLFAAGARGPDVSLTGGGGLEFGVATFLERPKYPDERRNQFFDMVTMTRGNHTFKLGGDFNHVTEVADNLRFYAGGYTYGNLNDFIIDYLSWKTPGGLLNPAGTAPMTCSSTSRTAGRCYSGNYNQAFGGTVYHLATNDYNFFGQDDWRVTPRVTLNLGLRWEYSQFPKPFIANPAIPQTGTMPHDKNNFGPRFGFAWDLKGDGKDSIRGGYGIYFGRMGSSTIYNALINTAMPGGQFQISLSPTCSGTPLPASCNGITTPIFPNTLAAPTAPAVAVQYFQNGFQLPTIHQADAIYEHELSRNTVVSVSLLTSFGKNLVNFVDTNINPAAQTFTYTVVGGPFDGKTYTVPWFYGTARPNPAFGAMTEIRSDVWSKYVGGVVQLNRRLTKGLQFQMNYTRSSARDTNQTSLTFTTTNVPFNLFDQSGEAGRSFVDVPNKFIANAVWQPQFKNPILKDWTISPIFAAYSGIPLPTFISGSIPSPGPAQDGSCWPGVVTANQCTTPNGGQNGSGGSARFIQLPRNFHRLPRIMNTDLRVSRRFRFTENTALEVLVEGFNIFNRTQVTGENNTYYSISTATTSACLASHATCTVNGVAGVPFNAANNTGVLTYQTAFGTTNAAGGTIFRERQVQFAVRFQF